MSKQKNIQIPAKLLLNMYCLIHDIKENNEINIDLVNEIEKQINEKIEAIEKRELYTKSKTAETDEEKEKARREYIEKAGIHKDFRW